MTRSGIFKEERKRKDILIDCWSEVGESICGIRNTIPQSGLSRDRYILELSQKQLEELTAEVWMITKQMLPHTIGQTSYGLVGASKILFSVLPEIVLPIDNAMFLSVFQNVDIGDIIVKMVVDTRKWEKVTKHKLNDIDSKGVLTTIPSVYNVMAMKARGNINPVI